MKSQIQAPFEAAYYVPGGPVEARGDAGGERFFPTPSTAGPWSATAQHGGPPAALLGRAIAAQAPPGHAIGSFAMDILGPIPLAPVRVAAHVVRPGRTVALLVAEMYDDRVGRAVARAKAWTFPIVDDGPGTSEPAHSHPEHGRVLPAPEGWGPGYLDSIEWRWTSGTFGAPGPAVTWARPTVRLVPGEELSGLQRLLTCVDSASGVSSALDIRDWAFMNTELTVTVLRQPVGEWICLDAETTLGPGAVGVAISRAYDERGLVGRSSQTLLVTPR